VFLALLLWVPGAALALWQGVALPGRVVMPFLFDPQVYFRYLVSVPLYIMAETTIDDACGQAIAQFVESGLVPAGEVPALRRLLENARRRTTSKVAAVVIALVAVVPLFVPGELTWAPEMARTWIANPNGAGHSLAGLWMMYVAQGIRRYIVFGWVWRVTIWAMLLGRITALKLREMPSHPDRAGGFGFLGVTQTRFAILAVASSITVMGGIARSIIFFGAKLRPMYIPIALQIVMMTLLLLLPLLALAPRLFRMRRDGMFSYGSLASHYTQRFDRKWVRDGKDTDPDLLGSTDIQSLADLGGSFDLVRQMKAIPIDRPGIIAVVLSAAAPYLPLILLDKETFDLAAEAVKRML
jgi:hypothetical protein